MEQKNHAMNTSSIDDKVKGVKVIEVSLPEYDVSKNLNETDYRNISTKIDDIIKQHYSGKTVVVRGISSSTKNDDLDEVIRQIYETGTDYEVQGEVTEASKKWKKEADGDLFGNKKTIKEDTEITYNNIKLSYERPRDEKGKPRPQKVDVIMIYDSSKLKQLAPYEGKNGKMKTDAYNFLNPKQKQEALIGIIKIV